MYHALKVTLDLYLARLAEQGEFEHLAGEGKPLDLSQDAPTAIDKLLAEAGARPVPVLLKRDIQALREQIAATVNPAARHVLMRKLADTHTRLAIEIEAYNRYR